jgi:antitoxin HicB
MKTGKDLNYYRSLRYKMVIDYDADEEVYVVRFPHLPGCIMHGETVEEAAKLGLQVKDEWIELALSKGWSIPEPPADLETTGRLTVRLPKSTHKKVIDRAEEERVSQNQLILSFIEQGLEKAAAEDSFTKIAAKQDELIRVMKAGPELSERQPTSNPLLSSDAFGNFLISQFCAPHITVSSYSSGLVYNCAPVGSAIAINSLGATETVYSVGAATGGEARKGLTLIKPKVSKASEDEYQGGYANEA